MMTAEAANSMNSTSTPAARIAWSGLDGGPGAVEQGGRGRGSLWLLTFPRRLSKGCAMIVVTFGTRSRPTGRQLLLKETIRARARALLALESVRSS
jgi:hypothetical protein